jgi:1,4-dihydroxy-2-naphthoate polyprenyltransferase
MRAFLAVARGPFLLLPVMLVAAGAAASAYDGEFSWLNSVLALVGLIAAHVGVNAINEAGDMQTGIDLETQRTPFSGGSGTIPAGGMTIRGAYVFGAVATAVGLAIGAWFTIQIGWILVPVLAVGAFGTLTYTHLLARTGLGEIFAGLGLGALPVIGTSLVQDGSIGPATIAASIPAFFMTFNLLLLNEFPDEAADRGGGRRNLVLLLGRPSAARCFVAAALATPITIIAAVVLGYLPLTSVVACLPILMVAPAIRWAMTSPETPVPMPGLGGNVAWNLITNLLVAGSLTATLLLS